MTVREPAARRAEAVLDAGYAPNFHARAKRTAGMWPYAAVTAAVLAAWWATVTGTAHIPYDLEFFHFPLLRTVTDMFASGTIPSWDPYTYGGVPLLANAQSAFLYPPHLAIAGVLALTGGTLSNHLLGVVSVVHLWIAGVGTVLVARRRHLGDGAAAFAGCFVCLCGFVVGESQHLGMVESLAWLPLAALMVDRCSERLSAKRVVAVGVLFFLALTSGFLPMVLPWILVLLGLALARPEGRARAVLGAASGVLVGVLLATAMWLPILVLRDYFPPLEPYNTHPLASLVTAIYPNAFGYWLPAAQSGLVKYVLGDYMYIGGCALLLVPLALARGRRALPEALLALAVLVMSIGPLGEDVGHLVHSAGSFALLYRPALTLYAGAVPIALFLARGLEQPPSRRALVIAGLAIIVLIVIPISDSQGHRLHLLTDAPRRELAMIVVGLALVVIASLARFAVRWRRLLMVSVALLGCAELASTVPDRFFANWPTPGATPASVGDNPIIDWLHLHLAPGQRVMADAAELPAEWAGFGPVWRLENVNGFQPQFSKYQLARVNIAVSGIPWHRAISDATSLGGRILPVTPRVEPYLREMNVRYIVAPVTSSEFRNVRHFTRVFAYGIVAIYRFDERLSRAWLLKDACTGSAARGDLRAPGCVVASVNARILAPETRSFDVPASGPRLLITGEPYYPGWSAEGSGRKLDVSRLGYLAAVRLPSGVTRLRLRYSPPGLLGGAIISLLTLLGCAAAFCPRRWRGQKVFSFGGTRWSPGEATPTSLLGAGARKRADGSPDGPAAPPLDSGPQAAAGQ